MTICPRMWRGAIKIDNQPVLTCPGAPECGDTLECGNEPWNVTTRSIMWQHLKCGDAPPDRGDAPPNMVMLPRTWLHAPEQCGDSEAAAV